MDEAESDQTLSLPGERPVDRVGDLSEGVTGVTGREQVTRLSAPEETRPLLVCVWGVAREGFVEEGVPGTGPELGSLTPSRGWVLGAWGARPDASGRPEGLGGGAACP